jgi:beta-lactamase superfamily II metal-dependent hydrolase
MSVTLPKNGMIFWPVGCGDSTTISVKQGVVMQVDLHHMARSEESDDPATPVVDELERLLPKSGNRPYLAVFALTHPDLDHVKGFKDLLDRVEIGELWFSPRVFDEYKKDLSDDALAFREEADRRVKECIRLKDATPSGDRILVIGYDEILQSDKYKNLPSSRKSGPGKTITQMDGQDCSANFKAFIHAPIKDDCSGGERNDTSLAFQIQLTSGSFSGRALLFGDLAYPTLNRIYEETSDKANLAWNVLLSPHHCSKGAMYWKDEGKDEETLREDIMKNLESTQLSPNWIISSSEDFPTQDEAGANPPHLKARIEYEQITENFICTHEHLDNDDMPHPIVFELTNKGLCYQRPAGNLKVGVDRVAASVTLARGSNEPPKERVGFGNIFD